MLFQTNRQHNFSGIDTDLGIFLIRQDSATAMNDSGVMIGEATETCDGPYPQAGVAIYNGGWYDDEVIFDLRHEFPNPSDPPTCVQGGTSATLLGINNGGTIIGTYETYVYGTNAAPSGPGGTIPDGLGSDPLAINDNGVIVGNSAFWFPRAGGGYDKKLNGPGRYVNNQMQTDNGWQDYRYQSWSNLLSLVSTNWYVYTPGIKISHNSGIILATAVTNSVPHAVLLVPTRITRDGRGISTNNT